MNDHQSQLREDCVLSPAKQKVRNNLERVVLAELNRRAYYLQFECRSLAVGSFATGAVSGFLIFHQLWIAATVGIILTTVGILYGFGRWMKLDVVNRALARVRERNNKCG